MPKQSSRRSKTRRQAQVTTKRTEHITITVDVAKIVFYVVSAVVALVCHFIK